MLRFKQLQQELASEGLKPDRGERARGGILPFRHVVC
jgi:hypothetical protein